MKCHESFSVNVRGILFIFNDGGLFITQHALSSMFRRASGGVIFLRFQSTDKPGCSQFPVVPQVYRQIASAAPAGCYVRAWLTLSIRKQGGFQSGRALNALHQEWRFDREKFKAAIAAMQVGAIVLRSSHLLSDFCHCTLPMTA
ncbi:hypothetical protein [Xenorhabdus bovienii]|uniref:hypothetical protein n=1 Tax=Xenorhabdus bovienii TaxID=40576 RepID=UPI003DA1F988